MKLTAKGNGTALPAKKIGRIAAEETATVAVMERVAAGHDLVVAALVGSLVDGHLFFVGSCIDEWLG